MVQSLTGTDAATLSYLREFSRWRNQSNIAKYLDGFLLLVCAIAQAASIAWPSGAGFESGATSGALQCLALAGFVGLLNRSRSVLHATLLGWGFSTVWLSSVFWWLFVAMHQYAGLHAMLAVGAVIALAAALSLYYAAASAMYFAWRGQSPVMSSLLFAAAWTAAEMARGTWLTGFGWGAIGYAHLDSLLSGFIPWVGAYGVTAIAAWYASQIAAVQRLSKTAWVLSATGLLIGGLALSVGPIWSQSQGHLAVTLLQGNIPQDEKFETGSGVPLALDWYAKSLNASRTSLVVAPETAVPLLIQDLPNGYWDVLRQRYASGQQAALVGIPLGDMRVGYTNSVVGLSPQHQEPWRYDKHHLVPFGEFIPPLFKWFTQMMNIPLGDFNRGAIGQPSFVWAGQRVAANICYEDLFGEELAARFTVDAESPTIFANVSNIGWFGDTTAIDQHLNISRMRAMEFERPFVRATNTGATVVIDHHGRVTAALPRHTRGVLESSVEGRTGNTPFARWASNWGLWPIWGICLAILGFAWYRSARSTLSIR